ISTPREVCEQVQVTRQKPVQDEHQILGTVAGAVIGGALGNQIGGGTGKKVATVAGAAAGGYAGNKTQERIQANSTYQATETRCQTITDTQEVTKGFDVGYRIGDEEGTVFMDHDPGDRIPLVDGELVVGGTRWVISRHRAKALQRSPFQPFHPPTACARHRGRGQVIRPT